MDRHMDELLDGLKGQLLRMAALAELMIADAVRMLVERDRSVEESIRAHEHEVNQLQVEIDESCLNLIALHQPAAGDLRFILGASKTNCDLERLADQAINIADKALRLIDAPTVTAFDILPRMATLARAMVKDSLHAFVNRDVQKSRAVLVRDDELDDLKREVTDKLVSIMTTDPARIRAAMDLALVARNLERIGDHATNIAENTIFVVEGRDIRHQLGPNGAGI
jgi:phosphate transport system protein